MALLEREEVKTKSPTTSRRSKPEYYSSEDFTIYSTTSAYDAGEQQGADEFLEPQPSVPPSRTPPVPSRCRINPQPIVGSARFDTAPVDGINGSGDDGSDPPDDDPEPRFGDPVTYFTELEDLEEDIVNHSCLELYSSPGIIPDFDLYIPLPNPSVLSSILTQSDDELVQLCRNATGANQAYAHIPIHLLRCRNMVARVYSNCERLISADFGGHLVNFLRVMPGRRSVAELVSYKISSIKNLAEEFDHALSRYLHQTFWCTKPYLLLDWSVKQSLTGINEACNNCLQDLGLWDWNMEKQPPEFLWYCAAQALDLAVVSFSGAHSQDFSRHIEKKSLSFDIPGPFVELPVHFTLRQRHLQCLDNFFGGNPVWVFHPSNMAKDPDEPLYLSTNMRDFSHIWGPVWGISASGNLKNGIKRYDVGGGSIYPWPLPKDGPKLFDEEMFCHWLPAEEAQNVVTVSRFLGEKDTLLIGAFASLEKNEMCPTTVTDIELRLQDSNSLHELRTSESSYYVDATSSSISLGGWGLNISGTRQWKRRNGQTLKSALIERWSHERDGSRMILDLVKGYGLEMSFCSFNAKRTRIFDLLQTKSMMRYLEHFDWQDKRCADKFLTILRGLRVDDLFWVYRENTKWRKDIQQAILLSLRILAECSVDEATGDLSIPWISRISTQSATFKKKEITWTRFLQDKRDVATFGLLVNKCLSFKEEGGRTCGGHLGKPVLQTSIRINRKMQDNWMKLNQRASGDYFWSISALYKKSRFPLGSQGSLTAIKVVEGALIMEWTSEGATKAFFKRAILWNEGMHHQEYIRAKWNATDYPINIFIESKQPVQVHGSSSGRNKLQKRQDPVVKKPVPLPVESPSEITLGECFGSSSSRPQTMPFEAEDTSHRRISIQQPVSITQQHVTASATRPQPSQGTGRNEGNSDLGSDDENPASERNGWKWDKKMRLWRRHVYTDGELDYTTWSRNPEQSDG